MAAGEYVSVSSQADAEKSDLQRERGELEADPVGELDELTGIYLRRGLTPELAREVAEQLTKGDVLATHARDELGITDFSTARPVQAALTSAITFAAGAALPLVMAYLVPLQFLLPSVAAGSIAFLMVLGALGAWAGGAGPLRGAMRVGFWGAAAMAATAAIGALFGTVIA